MPFTSADGGLSETWIEAFASEVVDCSMRCSSSLMWRAAPLLVLGTGDEYTAALADSFYLKVAKFCPFLIGGDVMKHLAAARFLNLGEGYHHDRKRRRRLSHSANTI